MFGKGGRDVPFRNQIRKRLFLLPKCEAVSKDGPSPTEAEMRYRTPLTGMAVLLATVWSSAAIAQNVSTLTVMRDDDTGEYVVDSGERPVYIHSGDEQGGSDEPAVSNCFEECTSEVPPLVAEEAPDAGEGVEESLIGTIQRAGGPKQVTYNGWPLYRPIRASEDTRDPGEDWHRIRPTGEPIE